MEFSIQSGVYAILSPDKRYIHDAHSHRTAQGLESDAFTRLSLEGTRLNIITCTTLTRIQGTIRVALQYPKQHSTW
eukprot:1155052-Pelagomonas_calceolata.AAC.5